MSIAENLARAVEFDNENPVPTKDTILPLGMRLSESRGLISSIFGPDRYLTIPQKPRVIHKALSYAAVKSGLVFFVRREDQYIDYAFKVNARSIFDW